MTEDQDGWIGTRTLVFLDSETTGLHRNARIWELGMVVRSAGTPDVSLLYQVTNVDMRGADPKALRMNKHADRSAFPPDGTQMLTEAALARLLSTLLVNVTIVGAVPSFDMEKIGLMLDRHGYDEVWHHRVMCVEAMTAAVRRKEITGLTHAAHQFGVAYDVADLHTALGDARLARDVFDAIMSTTDEGDRWHV